MPSDHVDVYSFLDSRRFLEAHFASVKRRRPAYSYRAFARATDLRSPNYLKMVIDGKRNLSEDMSVRFARTCGLDAERTAFFVELVRFTQASHPGERERAYTRMSSFLGYQRVHELEDSVAAYHAHWFIPAIRELSARADFRADPRWVAQTLVPSIQVSQARKAISVLVHLGLLTETEDGRLVRTDALVSTGDQTSSVHMTRFHREMLERASGALETMPQEEREISSVTLCMGPKGLSKLMRATHAFRRELLALEELEESPQQVFQVGLQVFPLSRPTDDSPTE